MSELLPKVSKSKISDMRYCKYNYYKERILGEKREDRDDAVEGTNLHMVFTNFLKTFKEMFNNNRDKLFSAEMVSANINLYYHPFRRFVYEACKKYVKPDHRAWGKYRNCIRNFASIETQRWLRLNTILTNKEEIRDCFLPIEMEMNVDSEEYGFEGRIDRVGVEVLPGGKKVICIDEYKTGRVPKMIMDRIDKGDYLDWKIPTHASKEIHFYVLAYLIKCGWSVSEEMKDFLCDPKWWILRKDDMSAKETSKWKKEYITKMGKKYKIFKEGKILNPNDIIVGYYYLNGDIGYRPIKKFAYASLKGVFSDINENRTMEYNKAYVTHPRFVFNSFACAEGAKNCSRYEECAREVEDYNNSL